jgi:Flp pilus assembly protein TadG
MKPPAISRLRRADRPRSRERGVTMLLVAVAMVAIIAMAALSIDVSTLYLAREEAQRSADAAALAAARIISVSGITADSTTDTSSWQLICGGATSTASVTAQAVAQQNSVGGLAPTVTVSYSSGSGAGATTNADCSTVAQASQAFAVNPVVTVKITRTGLPTLFSRVWGNTGNSVSASATAEAFNPSYSASYGNGVTGTIIPVQPRCVKPWVVPNLDPLNPGNPAGCGTNCLPFISSTTGQIQHPGISLNGTGTNGVIGETFWLVPDCNHGNPSNCVPLGPPQANYPAGTYVQGPPNLLGLPGQVGTPVTAVPSCSGGDPYEEAIEGCDAPTNYQCGVLNANAVDLTKHNPGVNSITDAVQCLIHQTDATNITSSSGQDYLNTFAGPSAYPFQILAGSSNPFGLSGHPISNSNSIVSLPIYDQLAVPNPPGGAVTPVTFIGFLQVFINAVDGNGNRLVTVLNVSGCGNGTNTTGTPVNGSSPVPVRLITPP